MDALSKVLPLFLIKSSHMYVECNIHSAALHPFTVQKAKAYF